MSSPSLLARLRSRPTRQTLRARPITLSSRLSSSSSSPVSAITTQFLTRFQSLGPQTRTQLLDANQLQLFSLTLNRPTLWPNDNNNSPSLSNSAPAPPSGTPLPPGYHLAYFTPAFLGSELGADGTDASYNPEPPFTRRMWAGGEVSWPRGKDGKPNLLRVGQTVRETTRVLSAEPKVVKKTGEDMIVVGVEKEFANEDGPAVIDRRNWVFRKALPNPPSSTSPSPAATSAAHTAPLNPPSSAIVSQGTTHTRTLVQTPVTLFRFSALTFNPHKIHYSLPWARDVEGHRDIVVHGPLNLISILDMWRDIRPHEEVPASISYRATSPLYAGDEYRIVLEEGDGAAQVQILGPDGVAMKADIRGSPVR